MSLEKKFFNLAVRESNCPAYGDVAERAAIAVMGAIEQTATANSRDGFIVAGLRYLETFDAHADYAIEDVRAVAEGDGRKVDKCLVAHIEHLKTEARQVAPSELFALLAADWDDRYGDGE